MKTGALAIIPIIPDLRAVITDHLTRQHNEIKVRTPDSGFLGSSPSPTLISCVTLAHVLDLCVPQFPVCEVGRVILLYLSLD